MTVESERRIVRLQAESSRGDDLECIPEESESDAGKYHHPLYARFAVIKAQALITSSTLLKQ
jgi:hypothetical protein